MAMATEKPAPSEILPHNGAGFGWLPAVRKYGVYDVWGNLHGYRRQASAARELAASLPGEPHEEPEPAPSRSPDALPLPPVTYMPAVVPREERVDFFDNQPSRVVMATASERSRALCRRQALAHDRVYGRHRRRR